MSPEPPARFLGPLRRLPIAPLAAFASNLFALETNETGSIPGFEVDHQLKSNWCWAAVTSGVIKVYTGLDQSTQDAIARRFLGSNYPSDTTAFLDRVLDREGVLAGEVIRIDDANATLSGFKSLLKPEIDSRRPPCAQVTFYNRDHYVGITGYRISGSTVYLMIQDPADQDPTGTEHVMSIGELRNSYAGEATWSHLFLTADN